MRHNTKKSTFHAILTGTGLGILFIALAAIFIHFSWNMAMPELFGAAKMSFKNAFGLVILLGTVAMLVGQSANRRHVRNPRHSAVQEVNE